MSRHSPILTVMAVLATPAIAQTPDTQPVFSDPYEVSDARAAMDEIIARDAVADAEAQNLIMSGEVDLASYVPNQPLYQDISWPVDVCTGPLDLFPSPPDGWGIASDWGQRTNPIDENGGELFYVRPPDLAVDDPNFVRETLSVVVRVTANSQWAPMWDMRIADDTMRDISFDDGPFGYPVMRMQNATMLGDYYVEVSGTGEDAAPAFLETIIGCAIDGGLLANGVDAGDLTR
ncbi:hypothetical protein [Pseudooctadecabacter sp.]|uniref:hypothetical protein n=1 Tax=Pseudooctadecabacter sp. TaxID=1966338 RepID=UPI0025CD3742|nr:hypothetical protein [Pseudooctadecabacter sp.]